MKKLRITVSVLLCLCFILPLMPSFETEAAYSVAGANSKTYKTYTISDSTFKWCPTNVSCPGGQCTSVQGLNIGTTYAYIAMRHNETYQSIQRYNMNTGATATMKCYDSLTDTTAANYSTKLAHANELQVVGIGSTNYMYVATATSDTSLAKGLARMKIDGTNLYFTGYIDIVNTSGTSLTVGSISHVKSSGGYIYMLCKVGSTFYIAKIPETMAGGATPAKATPVTAYKLFVMDKRSAVFAKSSTSASTYDYLESWTNQGFSYNKLENVLYVPLWDQNGTPNRNVIITFNLKDVLTSTRLDAAKNYSDVVYPTVTSFFFQRTACTNFEIESCGFRTGQSSTGDLRLYVSYNATDARSTSEGLWVCTYKSGTGDFTPVNEGTTTWTTKYNANGGTGSVGSTRHVYGISTKLAKNAFTRTGYTFAGWYLTRKSDGKWLYTCSDGVARWYLKGEQPVGARLALYSDGQSVGKLSTVEGDTVTCYAQWTPNSTGTTSFYIQYDANGGTGTMADTKVVKGTSTAISKNTFTREGYVFTGWTAFRRSDAKFAYKSVSGTTFSDVWLAVDATPAATQFLKVYADGCTVSATSSKDRDVITFYAAWARVKNPVVPTELIKGTSFTLGGTAECGGGMYEVSASVLNSAGTAVATYTASPYTTDHNLSGANSKINFSTLAVGTYTYKVAIKTVNGSSPKSTTILSQTFKVRDRITPPAKVRYEDIVTGTQFGSKYEVSFTYTRADGTAIAAGDKLGTGTVATYETGSSVIVLTSDIDGDGEYTATDLLKLKTHFKGIQTLEGVYLEAADATENGILTVTDYLKLKRRITG